MAFKKVKEESVNGATIKVYESPEYELGITESDWYISVVVRTKGGRYVPEIVVGTKEEKYPLSLQTTGMGTLTPKEFKEFIKCQEIGLKSVGEIDVILKKEKVK